MEYKDKVSLKARVYLLLEGKTWVVKTIYGLIIINLLAFVVQSYHLQDELLVKVLRGIEITSIVVFTIEYFARIWCADYNASNFKESAKYRMKYIFSALGLLIYSLFYPSSYPLFSEWT